MAVKAVNDPNKVTIVSLYLADLAGQLTSVANGKPLSIDQHRKNQDALVLLEVANSLREHIRAEPLEMPAPGAGGHDDTPRFE